MKRMIACCCYLYAGGTAWLVTMTLEAAEKEAGASWNKYGSRWGLGFVCVGEEKS